MNEWNIQSRAHACQACGKGFAAKQPFHTLLFDERRDYIRLDVCDGCWQSQYSQGASDRKGFISCWQSFYEPPPAVPPDAIQKENAETLLRKLIEVNDPKYGAAAFILAVMLERKRLLKVKEQFTREGRRIFIYEQPKTGDLFTIPDPALQLNQLDEVQKMVGDLLENGLPQPVQLTLAAAEPRPDETAAPAPADLAPSSAEVPAVEAAPSPPPLTEP